MCILSCTVLFRRAFWISGKYIKTKYLNGLQLMICYSLDSEPLALTVDAENQHLYWMMFDSEDNTVSLSQLSYTRAQCGTRYYMYKYVVNVLLCKVQCSCFL